MKNFWSLVTNGDFKIGCTGRTVYVCNNYDNELAKFKDVKYAYNSAISPKGDIFVVKSTEGMLAIYSLETLSLIKKFRFSKVDNSQDDGFCFSSDGKKFYNVERYINSTRSCLSIYNTDDFSLEKRLFADDDRLALDTIEYDKNTDTYYLIGYFRNEKGMASEFFVAKLTDDLLSNIYYISYETYLYYIGYKKLELMGFTDKSKEWSSLKYHGYDLSHIEEEKHPLADLWQEYLTEKE